MKNTKEATKGYILVATKNKNFVISAINMCEAILDYDINAKVTIATDQEFADSFNLDMFDNVLIPPKDPNREADAGPREKMWAMANTPYDYTFYMDSDMEIIHEEIIDVFDRLENNDLVFVELKRETQEHFAMWEWGSGKLDHLTHCGGVCLYKSSNPLVREFMMDWYNMHLDIRIGKNLPKECKSVPKKFYLWDQLTLWWLLWYSEKYKKLKWKFFEDNYRWNYYSSFGVNSDGTHNYGVSDPVIIHHSSTLDKTGQKGYL